MSSSGTVSKMLVVQVDHEPIQGLNTHGPHQKYRNSRISVQEKTLGNLHSNDIRVEILYAGICGTDVHLVTNHPETGYICCSAPSEIPEQGRVMGHEGVGRVLAAGQNITHLKPGDYITMESIITCHHCDPCKKGKFNQCTEAKLLGMEKDGIFGSVVDIPGTIAHDISALVQNDEDLQALACVEPSGVAYVACENARVSPGDVVLIFGAGPIGLLTAMISKDIFGASEIHIVEPVSFRRDFARQWVDYVYDVEEYFSRKPSQIDIVFEASGAVENVNRSFRNLNPNGRVVLLARMGETFFLEHVDHMITNEISITGSRGHLGGAFSRIFKLYKAGRLPLGEIITKVIHGQEQLQDLFNEKEKILLENCKVLVKLGETSLPQRIIHKG